MLYYIHEIVYNIRIHEERRGAAVKKRMTVLFLVAVAFVFLTAVPSACALDMISIDKNAYTPNEAIDIVYNGITGTE